jgi:hypothetical protein
MVRSMGLGSSVGWPHSLHTAEATGSKPVTPTSTNAFPGPCCDACCQQIASKPPIVVAVALKALCRFGVLRVPRPLENGPCQRRVRWDSKPRPWCSRGRGPDREGAPTCGCVTPVVTACARLEPAVPDAVGTQHGPAPLRSEAAGPLPDTRWKHGHPTDGAAVSALAVPLALVVLLRAPAMHVELAADPMELVAEAGHGLLPEGGHRLGTDNALPLGGCHPDNHADRRKELPTIPEVRVQSACWQPLERRGSSSASSGCGRPWRSRPPCLGTGATISGTTGVSCCSQAMGCLRLRRDHRGHQRRFDSTAGRADRRGRWRT